MGLGPADGESCCLRKAIRRLLITGAGQAADSSGVDQDVPSDAVWAKRDLTRTQSHHS